MKKILILAFALLCAAACMSEDDASDIILFVKPSSEITATSGDKIRFEIETWTIHKSLASVEISSFDPINGSVSLFSTTELSDRYTEPYLYEVPKIDGDRMTIILSFTVRDSEGNKVSKEVSILIRNDETPLKEYTSITMYSAYSGKEDAFSLTEIKTLASSAAEDKELDIFMYADPEAEDKDTFKPEWRSTSGIQFARAKGMDYSSITKAALNVIYNNSVKGENVSMISNDDIIIAGRENTALGVFKILYKLDEAGNADDRLVFSFKPAI